jgi:hypothetical protein
MAVDRAEIANSGRGQLYLVELILGPVSAVRNRCAEANCAARAADSKVLEQDRLERS